MKHLGVDWGARRIGVATSDESGRLAFAWGTRQRRGFGADVDDVMSLVRGLGAGRVVFGLPLTLEEGTIDETRARREAEMRRFAEALQNAARDAGLALEIAWQDERYSTREALSGLRAAGISQRAARDSDANSPDARAAAVILQAFLDQQHPIPEGQIG